MVISMMRSIMAIALIVGYFALAVGIVMYIFESIGLFCISKRRRIGTSAFAWIPFLNVVQLGKIADDARLVGERKLTCYRWITPLFTYVGFFCYAIGSSLSGVNKGYFPPGTVYSPTVYSPNICAILFLWVGAGLMLTGAIFTYISLYYIYRSCSESHVTMLVLSIIFAVVIPFFLFAIRNQDNTEYYQRQGRHSRDTRNGQHGHRFSAGNQDVTQSQDDSLFRQVSDGLWEENER